MKFIRRHGCTASELSVDGINEIDMTDEQRKRTINTICKWLKNNPDQLNCIIDVMIWEFGEFDSDGIICECCGDTIETWMWEI